MTRPPMHAPPAAPAVLVSESATGGAAVLGALGAAGCVAAALVLLAGPARQPVTRIPAAPVAAVTSVSIQLPDPLPPRPGQPRPTSSALVAGAGVPIGAPVPGWRLALADAASAVPDVDPLPADPAVERALARLRVAAAGDDADGSRAGIAALTALDHAFDQVGDPYVWGATGPDTFDCSGLTQWAYRAAGVSLPRVSRDQFAAGGEPVDVDDLLPGDLVFFATAAWDPGVVHHVGMYAGDGLMVAAPRPGLTVRVEPISAQGYVGAVRPVPAREPARKHEKSEKQKQGEAPGREGQPGDRDRPADDAATSTSSPSAPTSPSPSADAPVPTSPDPSSSPTPEPVPSSPGPDPEPTAAPSTTDAPVTPSPTIVLTPTSTLLRITVLRPVPTIGTP